MATLRLRRPKAYYGSIRKLKVFVDDEVVGAVANDETALVPLAPGTHRVRVTMDWARSPDLAVTVVGDEDVDVDVLVPGPVASLVRTLTRPGQVFALRLAPPPEAPT